MTAAQAWDAHVDAFMRTVGNTPTNHEYVGRRRAAPITARRFTFPSTRARARVAAQRADAAVTVLAATDGLAASRELYARLLRAGALSTSAVA